MQTFGTTGRGVHKTHRKVPPASPEVVLGTAPALHPIQILCSLKAKGLGRKQPFHPALGPRDR